VSYNEITLHDCNISLGNIDMGTMHGNGEENTQEMAKFEFDLRSSQGTAHGCQQDEIRSNKDV
jgi:hypothetical protein